MSIQRWGGSFLRRLFCLDRLGLSLFLGLGVGGIGIGRGNLIGSLV
jgi:hypothetical protein